jgi:hypothetical protein
VTEAAGAWTKPANWLAHDHSDGRILCHVEGTRVIIDHADPVIWISAETVSWAATGKAHPRIKLTPPPGWGEPGNHYWIGSVIRFHADNRDVLYRLTSWHGNVGMWSPDNIDRVDLGYYVAEWPD